MKNVKFGFQFAIGFYLGNILFRLPAELLDPSPSVKGRMRRIERNIKKMLKDMESEAKQLDDEIPRQTSAFPKCKNKIGFTIE